MPASWNFHVDGLISKTATCMAIRMGFIKREGTGRWYYSRFSAPPRPARSGRPILAADDNGIAGDLQPDAVGQSDFAVEVVADRTRGILHGFGRHGLAFDKHLGSE